MPSSSPDSASECTSCQRTQNQLPNPLKRCAKCKSQWYCSRECQKSDWKSHKKVCGNTRAEPNTMLNSAFQSAEQRNNPEANIGFQPAGQRYSPTALCCIPNPFDAIANGTWLHDRPKTDVFKLLVDTYRMKMEDEYVFQGEVDEDSLYGGADVATALRHFKRFLNNAIKLDAKRSKKLLPKWWSKDSLQECLIFARTDDFSNIGFAAEKHDIQEHYLQMDMPMQLRLFLEKLDGTVAGGGMF